MDQRRKRLPPSIGRRLVAIAVVTLSLTAGWGAPTADGAAQRRFDSLEEAERALVDALRKGDDKALGSIFGPGASGLVSSGDAVRDRQVRERFVAMYDEQHRLEGGGGKVVLVVGKDDFPLAIPLVADGPWWRWDTAAGREEIVNRRIGQNELNTIQVCLAYVDAQREYYLRDPDRNGLLQYARDVREQPGQARRPLLAHEGGRAAEPARSARGPREGGGLREGIGSRALLGLLLPDPDRPGQGRPRRRVRLPRAGPHDRRLRPGRLPGAVRLLRDHDVRRQPRRRRVREEPGTEHRVHREGDEAVQPRQHAGRGPDRLRGRRVRERRANAGDTDLSDRGHDAARACACRRPGRRDAARPGPGHR